MSEEYSDGIDTEGYLKYEKTQNRDVIETVERFNRAVKFRGSANDVIELISPILKKDSSKLLKDVWRNVHDSHENPDSLAISVDIVPPVMKKIHPNGDNDSYFRIHREYPFYYLLNLKMVVKFLPKGTDQMKDDEGWYEKWFSENVYPQFSKKLLERVRDSLATKFNNVFAFPTLENESKEQEDRINVIVSPILKFNKESADSGTYSRFDSTEEMREVLVSRISLALERIVRVK